MVVWFDRLLIVMINNCCIIVKYRMDIYFDVRSIRDIMIGNDGNWGVEGFEGNVLDRV